MFKLRPILLAAGFIPTLFLLIILQQGVKVWTFPDRIEVNCAADTILVMGAAQYDGVPSPAFQRRLDRALGLYEQGCAAKVLVTGGKREGDRYSEGQAGASYLASRGIPNEALLSETSSRTSFQNLANSQAMVGSEQLLIVTDDMHSYRTLWLAGHLGLNASMAPAKTRGLQLSYGLREWMILTAYDFGMIR